jgi:hypothetical protein
MLSLVSILWCTHAASSIFVAVLRMSDQRFLVAYPVGLLYGCFALFRSVKGILSLALSAATDGRSVASPGDPPALPVSLLLACPVPSDDWRTPPTISRAALLRIWLASTIRGPALLLHHSVPREHAIAGAPLSVMLCIRGPQAGGRRREKRCMAISRAASLVATSASRAGRPRLGPRLA